MSTEFTGSCACGNVHFEVTAQPEAVFNCHCTVCRKMNGAAFSTYAVFPKDQVVVTEGKEEVQAAEVGQNGIKHFCKSCGSPLYGHHKQQEGISLVLIGAIDTGGEIVPTANAFCRSKLSWVFSLDKMINSELGPRA